jgi:hypothetical protein
MGVSGLKVGARPSTYEGTLPAWPALPAKQANAPGRGSDRGRPHPKAPNNRNSALGLSAVTSRLALGEALLGLQQPMHHQQLAH